MIVPIKPFDLTLDKLMTYIHSTNLAIPEFQRGFVWKDRQVKALFDSLVKKYPIGSIIVWKTKQRNIGQRPVFTGRISKAKTKYFLLDGQQRMLSLYYLYQQDEFSKRWEDYQEICEKDPIKFEHYYLMIKNKRPVLAWARESRGEFDRNKFKKIMGNYKFPIIEVTLEDYTKAQEAFERINQSGTKISTESIFLSEAWNKGTNLGKILRMWKKDNNNILSSKLDNILFVHALVIIVQLEQIDDCDNNYDPEYVDLSLRQLRLIAGKIRDAKNKNYEKAFNDILKAMVRAMSFLRQEYNIEHIRDIPSQTMVTILSIFYYYCKKEPSSRQKLELRKWFWRSSLSSRYTGSNYNENVHKDPIKMMRLANQRKNMNITKESIEYENLLSINMHTGKSAIKNAIKIMLWQMTPIWIDGVEINWKEEEDVKKKKEDDHIYAYDFYNKGVIQDIDGINSILNFQYLTKTLNGSKKSNLMSEWLKIKEKEVDGKLYYGKYLISNLLPFKSIEAMRREENQFVALSEKLMKRKSRISSQDKKRFQSYYYEFLSRRFRIFRKYLNALQDGRNIMHKKLKIPTASKSGFVTTGSANIAESRYFSALPLKN